MTKRPTGQNVLTKNVIRLKVLGQSGPMDETYHGQNVQWTERPMDKRTFCS